jgi:hypothetical protein
MKEIVVARSCDYHTLPQRPMLCITALCALKNIHSPQTGVPCRRYVLHERCVRGQDRYLPSPYTLGQHPNLSDDEGE